MAETKCGSSWPAFWGGVFLAALLGKFAWLIWRDYWQPHERVRHEAVREGVARWVGAEDGSAKFEWIKPAAPEVAPR